MYISDNTSNKSNKASQILNLIPLTINTSYHKVLILHSYSLFWVSEEIQL